MKAAVTRTLLRKERINLTRLTAEWARALGSTLLRSDQT